ncbi:MAG: YggT family protein [Candidatus Dormibacteraeota bacterium]|nr:YggT family protein [Candidatus Dormibacteraeota bacterium]
MSIVTLVQLPLYAFLLCLVVRGFFSWIEPYPRNAVHRLTWRVTEPVVGPVRRLIPPFGGFDVAFVLVFFGVYFLISLVGRVLVGS